MSDQIFEEKSQGLAEKNDALRDAFERDGARLFLLKRGGQTSQFSVIAEITSGWQAKFNLFRMQMTFKFAGTEDAFADQISQTSWIAYGVPVENPTDTFKMETFSIDADRRDVIAPNGSSVYWKVFAAKTNELFTIPAEFLT